MNPNQHTVTIPIADYEELMRAKSQGDQRFIEMRDRMVKRLEEVRWSASIQPREFLADLIQTLKRTT